MMTISISYYFSISRLCSLTVILPVGDMQFLQLHKASGRAIQIERVKTHVIVMSMQLSCLRQMLDTQKLLTVAVCQS